jgi:hypothetical protein
MKRREFIHGTACAAGAAWLNGGTLAQRSLALPALSRKFTASDTVTLGKTASKPASSPWAPARLAPAIILIRLH